MACGNNKVSRGYLSSQPAPTQAQGDRLFATPVAPEKVSVGGKQVDAYYSQYTSSSRTTDYFLNDKGQKTFDPNLHVHVIHDDGKLEVRMLITDRRDGTTQHSDRVTLRSPSGNQVNAAEERLVGILRSKKS